LTLTGLTVSASPSLLTPIAPNNQPRAVAARVRLLPVTVAGGVTDDQGTPSLTYKVIDSDGRDQPSGVAEGRPGGGGTTFFFARFGLSNARAVDSSVGRRYTGVVTARDGGSVLQGEAVVTVPPLGFFTRAARRPPARPEASPVLDVGSAGH
jgi:hypothetical protein